MNANVIEGNPTKTFFIEMITRDISIEDAIIDLLDNSIDGANRINPDDYSGLFIDIKISEKEFCIIDNCGGFSLDTAQKYAFRFGRPEDAPNVNNAVGRFGIGMKRSLFKIGKLFAVESETESDHFKVEVDVDEWGRKTKTISVDGKSKQVDDWSFSYSLIDNSTGIHGTKILVSKLNNEVKALFSDDRFLLDLSNDIQKLLNFSLHKGIKITLNGRELSGKKIELLYLDDSKPYYADGDLGGVKYRLIAGLGEIGDPKSSGWYIYCNNRLVLDADTSALTGWDYRPLIPKWHVDFVMFRGLLFLDSEETLNLPLTTTKKGIDATSEVYKTILPLMRSAMVSVLEFLKRIPQMGDNANGYRQMLCEKYERRTAVELKQMQFEHAQKHFETPQLDLDCIAQMRDIVRIAFDAKKDAASAAKSHAGVRSFKELGSVLFDYYMRMEDIDYE